MITADLTRYHRMDEEALVNELLSKVQFSYSSQDNIRRKADDLVTHVRNHLNQSDLVDIFMRQYELSTQEGLLLMCLAEALLRIPDKKTAQALLEDKLSQANFEKYFDSSSSVWVNLSSKGLSLTAHLLKSAHGSAAALSSSQPSSWAERLQYLIAKSSEPLIRQGAFQAMRLLSHKFVMGRTIQKALHRARKDKKLGYLYSFDMLGEAAMTAEDANRYFIEYRKAIRAIKEDHQNRRSEKPSSISIKLSALHPRYEVAQKERLLPELTETLKQLAIEAKDAQISLTIDAEESERLELSLHIFEKLLEEPLLSGWNGLGLAVQAYQKRAVAVIDWLEALALKQGRRISVRLVKGAYWDSEIKRCQEDGLSDYPVFTCKASTDISYIACAKKLLSNPKAFSPAFATHNAQTIATILELAGTSRDFEFQRLHGMGERLYEKIIIPEGKAQEKTKAEQKVNADESMHAEINKGGYKCRVYAPVGYYRDLLPYLVRRLLENGANSSFVNQASDLKVSLESLNHPPQKRLEEKIKEQKPLRHSAIPLPCHLYGATRKNSKGIDLNNPAETDPLLEALKTGPYINAVPLIAGESREKSGKNQASLPTELLRKTPFQSDIDIGTSINATEADLEKALEIALKAETAWTLGRVEDRARSLQKAADLMEERLYDFINLCVYEGGKTIPDALSEVREAIDFCRYYAVQGLKDFGGPISLPGPTGERNELRFQGRGTFVCISPWNFPLAIFMGQVTASLMSGNAVIAKPAGQTPLIAYKAIQLLLEAGIPEEVLHFVPASGQLVSQVLLKDPRIAGICFTGSTETAWTINRCLAEKRAPLIPFIAETGGQNVMMVDSSALVEQVVSDIIRSAFQSAGQRCSALRILLVQEEIADRLIEMLQGAMDELSIGDPRFLSTDIGPVIDETARQDLCDYLQKAQKDSKLLYQCPLFYQGAGLLKTKGSKMSSLGSFVAPAVLEITSFDQISGEKFGPIVHILRYKASEMNVYIDKINQLGYGLTFGLHTRLDHRAEEVSRRIKAGNIYINRSMIGAVVGAQPFGGRGLSGTGPKAGGPYYLHRFAAEQTISTDTTAQGGNASLMTL